MKQVYSNFLLVLQGFAPMWKKDIMADMMTSIHLISTVKHSSRLDDMWGYCLCLILLLCLPCHLKPQWTKFGTLISYLWSWSFIGMLIDAQLSCMMELYVTDQELINTIWRQKKSKCLTRQVTPQIWVLSRFCGLLWKIKSRRANIQYYGTCWSNKEGLVHWSFLPHLQVWWFLNLTVSLLFVACLTGTGIKRKEVLQNTGFT